MGQKKPSGPTAARPANEAVLKRTLRDACHILAMEGQGDAIWGHASVRRPAATTFWMKPARLGLEEVTAEDLILVDLDGRVVRGKRPRHSEVFIHSEIFRARPDVCGVVHTHPVAVAIFSSLGVPLRPVTHEGSYFVPPDIARFSETTDLIVTPERGEAVARAIGDRSALLLLSHGIVTAGASLEEATITALLLDKAARAQLMLNGEPRYWTADEEAPVKRKRIYNAESFAALWAYLLRDLARWRRRQGFRR